jgi:uncharacterized repeat protein (TIGR01451 family)
VRTSALLSTVRSALAGSCLGLAFLSAHTADAGAQVVRAFSSRFSVNQTGDIRIIGNTMETCSPSGTNGASCANGQAGIGGTVNDNDFTMIMVDVDGDGTTFNSSTADLNLAAGTTVLFAGLYWGADVSAGAGGSAAPNSALRNQVTFRRPGGSSSTVTATQVDLSGSIYQSFADVTSLVQADGNGTYTVANLQAGTGANHYGGWSLIVAYEDPAEPLRNLTVNDGFAVVNGGTPSVSTSISGFLTPATGPVRSRLGAVVYEGDLSLTGDALRLNGTALSDANNPVTNPFNSSISRLGTRISAKNPDYLDQLGFDADVIDATGILGNSVNTATMSFSTGGETFYPGVVSIATELFAPIISGNVIKSVSDVNGGTLEPGDTLQYSIAVSNTGQDGAIDIVLTDTIPASTTYVPGSLQVTAGANSGAKTDAAADDQADFDAAGNRVLFRLGSGATGAAGGQLAPTEATTARFRVVVSPSAPSGTTIPNRSDVAYNAETLGTASTSPSTVTSDVVTVPDLAIGVSHAGNFTQGQPGGYSITVSNSGNFTSSGAVTVTDTLPTGLTPSTASGTGWSCGAVGQVVTCTRSDALAAAGSYPAITLSLIAAANAAGSLTNTAHVAGGGETNASNDTANDPTTVNGAPDLSITKSHAGGFNIGQSGSFTITVTNNGSVATTGAITVSDPLPAGLSFVSGTGASWSCSAAGQNVTCTRAAALAASASTTITLTVSVGAGAPSSVTNSASVTTAGDADPSNDSVTDSPVAIGGPADLGLAVSHGGTFVVGQNGTYTITATNNGAASTTGTITVTDVLPAGLSFVSGTGTGWSCSAAGQTVTCTNAGPLASGVTSDITLTVAIAAGALPSVTNSATVATAGDLNAANDSASDVTPVSTPILDLTITSTHSGSFLVGGQGSYTIGVSNVGNLPTTGPITVTDTLPAGLGFVSGSGTGWSCGAAGQVVTCTNSSVLAVGDTSALTLAVSVAQGGVPAVTHTVHVATAGDANAANDDNADPTTVVGAVDLAIAKRHSGNFTVGVNALYAIVVSNVGNTPTNGVITVTDSLPSGLGFVTGSGTGWSCAAASTVVTCTNTGPVAPSDSSAIALAVSVDAAAMPSVTNSASLVTPGDSIPGGNNTTTDVPASVTGQFALFAEKSASRTEADIGDIIDYTVRVRSAGTSPVPSVSMNDRLPLGFAYLPGSARIDGAAAADPAGSPGPVLSFPLGQLSVGTTVTVTYRARIGAGARAGSNANTALARSDTVSAVSNAAVATVQVGTTGGVFDDRGTIVGTVYSQTEDGGSKAGIPGVRVYLEDGTSAVTDEQGKYHFDGVSPRLHVVKIDRSSLPPGAVLVAIASREAGDGYSRFVDLTKGELQRADFMARTERTERTEKTERTEETTFAPGYTGLLPTDRHTEENSNLPPAPLEAARDAEQVATVASSSRLELSLPGQSVAADGSTHVPVHVRLLDAGGAPRSGTEAITLETSLGRWAVADEDRTEPGIQTYLHNGVGDFTLIAPPQAGRGEIRVTAGTETRTAPIDFAPAASPLMATGLLEASLDLRSISRDALAPARPEDGFEQTLTNVSFDNDDLHGAVRSALVLKGKVKGDYLLTLAFDTERDPNRTLFRDIQPDQFYPVYGDASVREFDAQTAQRLYVRVDKKQNHFLYGDFTTTPTSDARELSRFDRSLTGAVQHLEGSKGELDVFASRGQASQVIDEIPGLGISGPYTLSRPDGRVNSEKVEIITRDRNQPSLILQTIRQDRFTDYEFEPFTGRVLFRAPVPSLDANLNPVSIRVSYEVEGGGDPFWIYGADGRYRVAPRLELGGAYAKDDNPVGDRQIWGLNSTVDLGGGSYLLGEFGRSDNNGLTGNAERVEFRNRSTGLDLRVYGARSDSGFANPSSTFASGRLELGLRGTATIDARTRLIGEALRTEDRITEGHREGASFSVERRLSRTFLGELGYRYGHETDTSASQLTAGATPNETNAIRGRLTARIPGSRATVFSEYEQDVAETNQHRGAIGGEYRIASRARLYGRHEWITSLAGPYALNGAQHLENTVVGIDADYFRSNRVFSEYRARDAFSGRETEAAIGLRNRWPVAPGWLLNTSLERVSPISGAGSGRATAVTGAVEYTGSPVWKGSGRLEYRDSPSGDNFLGTVGYARKLSDNVTLLGRTMWNALGADQWRERSQMGLAIRPPEAGSWNGLVRYEHHFERLNLSAGRSTHTASVVAGVLNYQPRPSLSLSWRYAGKLAGDNAGDSTSVIHSNAQLLMQRVIVDLSSKWDAGLIGSILVSQGFDSRRYGLGVEAGRRLMKNLRLAGGYNLFGFNDRDLVSSGYTSHGVYIDLGFKFDEGLFESGTR